MWSVRCAWPACMALIYGSMLLGTPYNRLFSNSIGAYVHAAALCVLYAGGLARVPASLCTCKQALKHDERWC